MAYSVTMGSVLVLAQNDSVTCPPCAVNTSSPVTEEEIEEAPAEEAWTGQDSVPVVTANGTQVAQAAPAESINTLLTTIFVVAIPAVTGLIAVIANIIKGRSTNKHVQENAQGIIDSVKYIDTIAPKIHEQYVASGATKQALDIVIQRLSPEDQGRVKQVTDKIPDADKKIQELSAQLQEFRARLPAEAKADNDTAIPRFKPTVKTDDDKVIT